MEEAVKWLEERGWDVSSGEELRARRQRGERIETVRAGRDGRLRYTLTVAIGEEESRRFAAGEQRYRVVARSYRETTVTAELGGGSLRSALETAIQVSREQP